jgi:predicted TIM-barrel fold metal-dependent hydrolase
MVQEAEAAVAASNGASVFGHPAIDCDAHVVVPSIKTIMPHLDAYWRQQFLNRGIDKLSWSLTSEAPNAPVSGRPDWRPVQGKPGTELPRLRSAVFDGFGVQTAIATCLWGGAVLHSEDMSAVVCSAVNDWLAAEWLAQEPRLRASIVLPLGNPELAANEIERRAGDRRFVSATMLVAGETPLGKRHNWPIFRAAEKHGMPVAVHAGSTYHHPMMANGFGSYFLEDYVAQAFAFESAVLSLVSEGVFA